VSDGAPGQERYEVTYRGSPAFASALAQMLEDQGVSVQWERPEESRGLGADVHDVVISILSTGSYAMIQAAIAQFKRRFPRAGDVDVKDADEPR
jgi:hypothetical protein